MPLSIVAEEVARYKVAPDPDPSVSQEMAAIGKGNRRHRRRNHRHLGRAIPCLRDRNSEMRDGK
jgi:hypothetical protein